MRCFRLSRHFIVYLLSLCAILLIAGCVQSRGGFVSKNHVVLAEQNPSTTRWKNE